MGGACSNKALLTTGSGKELVGGTELQTPGSESWGPTGRHGQGMGAGLQGQGWRVSMLS